MCVFKKVSFLINFLQNLPSKTDYNYFIFLKKQEHKYLYTHVD